MNLLQSVERWLTYAISHYRRAVDMFVPASAPWAHVTLYYGSFFAANAFLGMFGGWIGRTASGYRFVDVDRGTPGSQELQIHRKMPSPSGASGSHRVFWDVFYDSSASVSAWVLPEHSPALVPVNGDYAWQIEERNKVNYDMYGAWETSVHFYESFKPAKLKTLSGPLRLQLETTERMIALALHFAGVLALPGVGLAGCGRAGTRLSIQRRLVTQRTPSLVTQSAFSGFLA